MRAAATFALAGVLGWLPAPAAAEVVDRSASGFTIRSVLEIAAPPEAVYGSLAAVGEWWDAAHTYSGQARNLSIAAQPGGCFCETLPGGGAVEHGRVIHVVPGALLRLSSALGPLQELGVAGSLTFALAKSPAGSTLTLTYAVGGYRAGGLDALAAPVDGVLTTQLTRLKEHAERTARRR